MSKITKHVLFINPKVEIEDDTTLALKLLKRRVAKVSFISDTDETKIIEYFYKVKNSIDILIIDHHTKGGIELIDKLLAVKPKQRLILLSGSPYCSDVQGCEHCQENYFKRRLLKPITKQELLYCIEFFDEDICRYKNLCEVLDGKNFRGSIV